jgi:preprotein translocase subunit SecF
MSDDFQTGDEEMTDGIEESPEEVAAEMAEYEADVVRDKKRSIFWKLYHGETNFRFIEHRRRWFAFSGAIILAGLIAIAVNGLNFGIDFEGGRSWRLPTATLSESDAINAVRSVTSETPKVQIATSRTSPGGKSQRFVIVQAKTSKGDTNAVTLALAKKAHIKTEEIDVKSVSSSWGGQITHKAVLALVVFFVFITIYISWRFEPKMAFATFVALVHDIAVTVGIYAIFGFEVTPATVIAVLTIQGYSIYDTIVVFDKIDENTRGLAAGGRMTYSEMVNLSLNQVLMRSINTSLTALMPIVSLLVVGSAVLGVSELEEFALALFVGLLAGAYSSLFIASPVLAMAKEREPRYMNIRQRLAGKQMLLTPASAAASGIGSVPIPARGGGGGTPRPQQGSSKPKPPGAARSQPKPRKHKKKKRR